MIVLPVVLFTLSFIQFAIASTALYSVCCKPTISSSNQMVGLLLAFTLNFLFQRFYQAYELYVSIIVFSSYYRYLNFYQPLMLFCGYFVPVLGIVTFFVLTHGLLKIVLVKTFKQFLTNLQKHSNSENRERIEYVLDKFDYTSLCQYTAKYKEYLVLNPLLGVLMIPFFTFLGLSLYASCSSSFDSIYISGKGFCIVGLSLGLVFNIMYILVGIGWLITTLTRFLTWLFSCCMRGLRSPSDT